MDPTAIDAEPTAFAFKSPKTVSIALPTTASTTNQHETTDSVTATTALDDAVAWPINRCCYEELKSSELAAVEQLFVARDDAPSFLKWVVVHKPPHQFAKRLLVLSSFRVWLLKRSHAPFKSSLVVTKEYQLLHLDVITVLRLTTYQPGDPAAPSASIKMRFHSPKAHDTTEHNHDHGHDAGIMADAPVPNNNRCVGDQRLEIHFDPGIHAETIVRLCQRQLHAMRLVFPGQTLPALALPPQCPWHEFFTLRTPSRASASVPAAAGVHRKAYGDAMATAYRCFCDDLGVPYRASVATRLRECLDASCVDVSYCLSTATSSLLAHQSPVIPARHYVSSRGAMGLVAWLGRVLGVHGLSASATQAKEVHALARTLEHCHDFEDIVAADTPLSDVALRALFQALQLSSGSASSAESVAVAVKGLSLTNVGLTTRALRTLQHVVLQSTIRRPLPSALPSTTAASLSLPLRRLDLSFNAFSGLMAHALATTIELLPSGLDALQLEQCRLSMLASARVLTAMKASHGFSSCLRELNLSGNTLGIDGTRALALWITGAFALYRLDLSRTRLQTNAFFRAFQQNSILHESSLTALDLSYNRLGTHASVALGDILGKTQSLRTLVLRGMKQTLLHPRRVLGDLLATQRQRRQHKALPARATHGLRVVHLKNVLGPMLQNSARTFPCQIDLSENDLRGTKAATLAHLLDSAPPTALAALRVDDAQLSDKSAVLLLHALRACRALEALSLEGNGFVPRRTKQHYHDFHRATASRHKLPTTAASAAAGTATPVRAPAVLERAAADALSLLLGGTTSTTSDRHTHSHGDGKSDGPESAHSFTYLYQHHHTKRVPLRELSLRARTGGSVVFGAFVATRAVHALATNTTLQVLDVSGNACGDALARALGEALPVNTTLRSLYWDDNFTTVDGFGAFYDGLLRNQSLSVVQLPINDTRRILEEQKDPPREKLFSVLGKIFKVTERNQTLALAAATPHGKSPRRTKRDRPRAATATTETTTSDSNQSTDTVAATANGVLDPTRAAKLDADEPEEKHEDAAPTSPRHVDVAVPPVVDGGVVVGETEGWRSRYATRSRYPTTLQSWSRDGDLGGNGDGDVRASWDQIGSLAAMLT